MSDFLEFVLSRLPRARARVLEVGCGVEGGLTPALAAAGYDVLGIDPHAPEGPLFRSVRGKTGVLTSEPLRRDNALAMVKRRAIAVGLSDRVCCHTFRATGITAFLRNGGTIENAARIAAHESTRTTQLYNRTADEVSLDEIERILI